MITNNALIAEKLSSLSGEEILMKIKKSNLHDYGAVSERVSDLLSSCNHEVIGALNNADTDERLDVLLTLNPDGIVTGLAAVAKALGTEQGTLYVTKEEFVPVLAENARRLGFKMHTEVSNMVNVRTSKGAVKLHYVTLAAISDLLVGDEAGVPLIVNGQLKEAEFGKPLSDYISTEDVKGVLINHTFYPVSILKEPLTPGFPLGSGVIVTIKNTECIVCAVKRELHALREKCCGKCTFCREGLFQMDTMVKDITESRAKKNDYELLAEIGESMLINTNCTLGRAAVLPVLSAHKNFEDEFRAHMKKKCPAGECKAFSTIFIDPAICEGNGECIDVCPKGCIEGKYGYISMIDEFDCTKCGECIKACPAGAVQLTSGRLPKLPKRLTRVGRFKK